MRGMTRYAILGALMAVACEGPPKSRGATTASSFSKPRPVELATRFAEKLSSSFAARDATRGAALFAEDAASSLVGDSHEARGRAAIEKDLGEILDRYKDARLAVGRVWVGRDASVIEVVFSGTRSAGDLMGKAVPERPVGLVGALVVAFGDDGLVMTQRVYIDLATAIGQVDKALLPDDANVRAVTKSPPAGTDVLESKGTPAEAKNLEVANRIWGALEAHDAEDALAPMSDAYVYEDYAAPVALNKSETQRMVAGFLGALSKFKIPAKPVQIAAGDDVVTETDEVATFKGKPTNKVITLHGLTVMRFADGKVVKQWQYANSVELLTQLGAMPAASGP